ncbi:MAG: tetratricopeptide repeat protein [Gammaproteobacteria bacterium]|nr:tetratricopeptide repeat protein [Gammaproteobacteria bacterium]
MKKSLAVVLTASVIAGCGASYNKSNPSIGKMVRRNLDVELLKLENTAPPEQQNTADAVEQHQAEAIENYRAYIALLPEGPAKRQAMRRLADLLVTQGPQESTFSDDPLAADDFGPGDGVDGAAGPSTLYQQLLSDAEGDEEQDVLLYQLARAYLNDGKPGPAVETLRKLVIQHPDSSLRGEANLRRGELQFIRKNFADSRQAYEAVLTDGDAAQFHEQALYKLGWSLYKLEEYELALDRLHELLDPRIPAGSPSVADTQFDPNLTDLPRARRELVQDALRVQSLALAWLEASKPIEKYLAERPKRHYESLMYARLGELYISRERYRDAARTWQTFVDNNPQHGHAPLFSAAVIDAWEGAGFLQPVLTAKASYATLYAPRGKYWGGTQVVIDDEKWVVQPERTAPHVIGQVRKYTRELAEHYHAVSQKPGGGGDEFVADPVTEAAKWYEHYLTQFNDDEDTPALSFLYAELLFENQRWEQAAKQYEQSAYKWHRHDNAAEAGYGAVLSWRKLKEEQKAANGGKFDEASILASENMIEASVKLADQYPTHPEVAPSLVAAVEDLYVLGDLPRTISLAKRVINMQPTPAKPLLFTSWLMTAQAELDREFYPEAEVAWDETLKLSRELETQNIQKHANYIEQIAASIYYQAQRHLQNEEPEEAVTDFMRVVTKTPTATIVATAHFDAANTLMQMEAWDRAEVELVSFRQRYPSDERQPQIDRKLATTYLALNQPGNAAREFQRIGLRQTETSDTRREALWRSAQLYDEAKWDKDAAEAWERYVRIFPAPFTAAIDARQRLIELAIARNDGQAALKWQRELLRTDQNGGEFRNERSRLLASRAAREIAVLTYSQFERLNIAQPFKKSLQRKKQAMRAAIDAWNTVQGYRFADQASEAAHHQAEIQANLADSLIYSQRPNGLSELALDEYELLLEEQAEPFESSAIKGHEGVTQLLIDQDILDEWVRKSVKRLGDLYPSVWSKKERGVKHVDAN